MKRVANPGPAEIAELAGPLLTAAALAFGLIWLPAQAVDLLGFWLLFSVPAGMVIARFCALTSD